MNKIEDMTDDEIVEAIEELKPEKKLPPREPNRAERRADDRSRKVKGSAQRKLDAIAASRYHAKRNKANRKKKPNG